MLLQCTISPDRTVALHVIVNKGRELIDVCNASVYTARHAVESSALQSWRWQ